LGDCRRTCNCIVCRNGHEAYGHLHSRNEFLELKYIGLLAKKFAELNERREVTLFDVFSIMKKARIDIEKLRLFMETSKDDLNYFPLPRGNLNFMPAKNYRIVSPIE